ncbi:MAG TPA: SpoIIE family protein phosphatase [Acidimicrobiia bacterium]|nr:SpoIIE family protein phosphatase [Acidimicrobiia bacterium]
MSRWRSAALAVASGAIGAAITAALGRAAVGRRAPPVDDAGNGVPEEITVAAALLHARTPRDVGDTVVRQTARLFGASVVRFAVRGERDSFEYVGDSLPEHVHGDHAVFSLHGEDPAAHVLQSQVASYWPRFDEFARRHGRAARVLAPVPVASLAMIPIVGERHAIGVWVIGFADPQTFGRRQRAHFEHVAAEISVALERALLFEFEQSVAAALQTSLLGPPALVEGAGHTARYLPAESALSVGGDWHDTIPLAERRIGVAVGDAVGRGLEAATVMGQLRSALGACALRSDTPAAAIDCLDEFAANIPAATSTTVAYAVVDLEHDWVDYCCAGHPPPLCVMPDGSSQLLEASRFWPLGCRTDVRRESARHPFPPGALLVLYSDGLVERRRRSLDEGFDRLVHAVGDRARLPIDFIADGVLRELLADSDGVDDVVLLVLRSPVSSPTMLLRKLHATPGELATMRAELHQWLDMVGLPKEHALQLVMAVGEACMNVVQHAYTNELHQLVRLEGAVVGDEVLVSVTDTGTWKEHSTRSVGGRGMDLMRKLVPSVQVNRHPVGTTVVFRYPREPEHLDELAAARA